MIRRQGKWIVVGLASIGLITLLGAAWWGREARPVIFWRAVPAVVSEMPAPPTLPPGIEGQVLQVLSLADGGWAYAWAKSAMSPAHFITTVPADGLGATHRIDFVTRLFATDGERVYFATAHARVGAVDAAGGLRWELRHEQTPTVLSTSGDRVLMGDRLGRLTVYGPDGEVQWWRDLGPGAIRGCLDDGEGGILVWTRYDRAYWLDGAGRMRGSGAGFPSGARPPTVPVGGGELYVIDHANEWWRVTVDRTALVGWRPPRDLPHRLGWWGALLGCGVGALVAWRWRPGLGRELWRYRVAYLMIAPTFGLLLLFEYGPAVAALGQSLFELDLTNPPRFVGLANFMHLWDDPYVWTGFRNLGMITLAGVAKLILPLLAAELVFWLSKESWRQVYRTLFLLPGVVPGLVTILLWKMIYDPSMGLANQLLGVAGLEHWQQAWLANPATALGAIIFAGFPWITITAFLVFMGGLLNIPTSLFESATMDGARSWQRFCRIDLPLIAPQLRLLLILTVIGSVQEFASVLVMTRGGPGIATYTPALHMFLETTEGANIGYAAAIGIVLFVMALAGSWVIHRSFDRWER